MATTEQVIEYLRKLSAYKERPECDSDGIPYYVGCGNSDDTYGIGETDGGINLAKALIDALDNGNGGANAGSWRIRFRCGWFRDD
jgi:hypothetical protein